MRTTDGGASWDVIDGGKLLRNAQIAGVAPRGPIIVVASDKGLFRSSEDGQWKKISGAPDSGLPGGYAFDLASDPADPARLYANAGAKGIFQSLDSGATWTKISDASLDKMLTADTANIRIAVGPNHTLYVAAANYTNNAAALAGLFRSGEAEPPGLRLTCRAPSKPAISFSASTPADKPASICRLPPTTPTLISSMSAATVSRPSTKGLRRSRRPDASTSPYRAGRIRSGLATIPAGYFASTPR